MYYYQVLVTSNKYHGTEPLTYSSNDVLKKGHIVLVPLKNLFSPAIIIKAASKPSFKTKPIVSLLVKKPLPLASLELFDWLQNYYPSLMATTAAQLLPSNLMLKKTNEVDATAISMDSGGAISTTKSAPQLTNEQQDALDIIHKSNQSSFLLHGDTGSGKTRVYLELVKESLRSGHNAVILTPEISLTSQLALNFRNNITEEVLVLHSNLTPKERRDLWLQVLYSKAALVIIGPRSALFAPFNNIGIIIVDECHDGAYKQEQSPYYSALRVASALAKIHKSKLIFGSATPLVTEYYIASQKKIPIVRMQKLAIGNDKLTRIEVVNARDRNQYTKSAHLSNQLLGAIEASIKKNEQSLVFLNRRGTARLVMCQDCDWQALCPKCDLPLTYHGDSHTMRCHTCGFKQQSVTICPVCGSSEIIFKSFGTKAIETQLQKIFPNARIKRFDTDNSKAEQFNNHYQEILDGGVDILVGTQMLVKGLDLPRLSVVGVVAADSSLYFPDYTAEEQTYQLLSQVIGRVARGHRDGMVVIQTYDPKGTAQQAALKKDWELFYSQQLLEREQFMFPPYCYLLKLTCSRKTQKSATNAAEKLRQQIKGMSIRAQIIGPSPRFNEKAQGTYNWQITLKSKNRNDLLKVIHVLPAGWSYDIDPSNLL